MDILSAGLPYTPALYDRNSFRVISTADPNFIIRRRQNRVLLWITPDTPLVAINPAYNLEQIGEGQTRINVSATGELFLFWEDHNILTTLAVFASGFGIGTIFNVTEVFYNPLPTEERSYATRKHQTTKSKIQDTIFRFSSSRRNNRVHNSNEQQ